MMLLRVVDKMKPRKSRKVKEGQESFDAARRRYQTDVLEAADRSSAAAVPLPWKRDGLDKVGCSVWRHRRPAAERSRKKDKASSIRIASLFRRKLNW